jgi:hypothetical protein
MIYQLPRLDFQVTREHSILKGVAPNSKTN